MSFKCALMPRVVAVSVMNYVSRNPQLSSTDKLAIDIAGIISLAEKESLPASLAQASAEDILSSYLLPITALMGQYGNSMAEKNPASYLFFKTLNKDADLQAKLANSIYEKCLEIVTQSNLSGDFSNTNTAPVAATKDDQGETQSDGNESPEARVTMAEDLENIGALRKSTKGKGDIEERDLLNLYFSNGLDSIIKPFKSFFTRSFYDLWIDTKVNGTGFTSDLNKVLVNFKKYIDAIASDDTINLADYTAEEFLNSSNKVLNKYTNTCFACTMKQGNVKNIKLKKTQIN